MSSPTLDEIIDKRFKAFMADQKIGTLKKASDFLNVQDKIQELTYSRKRTPYWFITINPKPEVDYDDFHNRILDLVTNESVSEYLYSFEVRNSDHTGLHAHVLLECHTTDKNFADRKIKKLFVPELCGNPKHVDIKWVSYDQLPEVVSYIKKDKVSRSKKASNDATLDWRSTNNIPAYIVEGEHLTCLCSPPNLILLN